MIGLSTVRDLVAIFGVIAGFSYYVLTVKNTSKVSQKEQMNLRMQYHDLTYMDTWSYVMSIPWTNYEEWRKNFDPSENQSNFAKYIYVGTRYQNIGLMLKEKSIDPDLVFEIFTPRAIIITWEKYLPAIQDNRERFNNPRHYANFEYLYNEAKKRYPNIITAGQIVHG